MIVVAYLCSHLPRWRRSREQHVSDIAHPAQSERYRPPPAASFPRVFGCSAARINTRLQRQWDTEGVTPHTPHSYRPSGHPRWSPLPMRASGPRSSPVFMRAAEDTTYNPVSMRGAEGVLKSLYCKGLRSPRDSEAFGWAHNSLPYKNLGPFWNKRGPRLQRALLGAVNFFHICPN